MKRVLSIEITVEIDCEDSEVATVLEIIKSDADTALSDNPFVEKVTIDNMEFV